MNRVKQGRGIKRRGTKKKGTVFMMVSVNFMHQSIPAAFKPPLPLEICLQRQKMLMPRLEPGGGEGGLLGVAGIG